MKIKHLLSFTVVCLFVWLALASAPKNAARMSFAHKSPKSDSLNTEKYLVKNDGTKIYGSEINYQSGLIYKDMISIDDQKFKMSEIKGYQSKGNYYARYSGSYIKRIIVGKINVYFFTKDVTMLQDGRSYTSTETWYLYQKGDNDFPLKVLNNKIHLKEAIGDCPLAFELVNKSWSESKKDKSYYSTRAFQIYNNDCKE
jgi:hypothetical protein